MARLKTTVFIVALVILVANGSPTAAQARESFLRPPDDVPALAQATVVDRPPSDKEAWGTLMTGTNVSVMGAKINRASFAFGAIGGLVGFGAMQAKNRERGTALDTFTQTDLPAMLRSISSRGGEVQGIGQGTYELVPVVSAMFTDETHFNFSCIISVSLRNKGQRWLGRSQAFPPSGNYDASSPESLATAAARIEPCMREAYGALSVYIDHYDRFGAARPFHIESIALDRPILFNGLPDRHLVNDFAGVVAYPSSSITTP